MSGGYDSNPSNLGDDLALPPELEQRSSAFIEAEALAKFTYDFAKQRGESGVTDRLKLSYDFIADLYTDISGNDLDIHTLGGSYKRSLCSTVVGELRLTDIFVQSDGNSLYNLFQVRPAFLISESEFDEIFARICERRLPYWADPGQTRPGEINHHDGGRGLYFEDPNGHLLEIITRPYGSGGWNP